MKLFALTSIERGATCIAPGGVFDGDDATFNRLSKSGGARKATDDEVAIARARGTVFASDTPALKMQETGTDATVRKTDGDDDENKGGESEDETDKYAGMTAAQKKKAIKAEEAAKAAAEEEEDESLT